MIRTIIIDDEPLARAVIKEYILNREDIELVDECNNGYEGLKSIEQHQPDLIFLDIQMPKINGFEMLELIEQPPAVIFTTAFDEYALKAFEVAATDYLLKPFSEDRFHSALDKFSKEASTSMALQTIPHKQPDEHLRIVIKDGTHIKVIPTANVSCLEAYDDYVKIHTSGKTYLKKKTLSYFEQVLQPGQFIRIHRSFIININELTGIESFEKNSYRAILKDQRSSTLR